MRGGSESVLRDAPRHNHNTNTNKHKQTHTHTHVRASNPRSSPSRPHRWASPPPWCSGTAKKKADRVAHDEKLRLLRRACSRATPTFLYLLQALLLDWVKNSLTAVSSHKYGLRMTSLMNEFKPRMRACEGTRYGGQVPYDPGACCSVHSGVYTRQAQARTAMNSSFKFITFFSGSGGMYMPDCHTSTSATASVTSHHTHCHQHKVHNKRHAPAKRPCNNARSHSKSLNRRRGLFSVREHTTR